MNATRREWYGQRLHVTMVPKEQSTRVFSQVDSHKQRFPEKMAALDEQIVRYCLQNIRAFALQPVDVRLVLRIWPLNRFGWMSNH
ncbi:hypothetical protein QR680_002931 [Steinernema hermaphroditum]|uniref:Uncharacterized protein n=1 Tax=Steinernema hermaphroditum TaxID=289476 RepID=A0AA39LJC2_9BILA|nr:hypothetical protein QR680_002931 [Steinernema hermaphroditum]